MVKQGQVWEEKDARSKGRRVKVAEPAQAITSSKATETKIQERTLTARYKLVEAP